MTVAKFLSPAAPIANPGDLFADNDNNPYQLVYANSIYMMVSCTTGRPAKSGHLLHVLLEGMNVSRVPKGTQLTLTQD